MVDINPLFYQKIPQEPESYDTWVQKLDDEPDHEQTHPFVD